MQYIYVIHKHKYPSGITKLKQIKWVKKSCLAACLDFSFVSTTNSTPGSASTRSLSGVSATIMHEWVYVLAWCHGWCMSDKT